MASHVCRFHIYLLFRSVAEVVVVGVAVDVSVIAVVVLAAVVSVLLMRGLWWYNSCCWCW